MSHELTVFWVVAVGLQLALQAPINSGLGRSTGKFAASLISNTVGLSALLVICLVAGELGRFDAIGDASLPSILAGLSGAVFVASSTITISRIGAGAVAAALISGQLTMSLIIDDFGWVGVDEIGITAIRIVGAVLLLAGTGLVVYRKEFVQNVEGAGKAGLVAIVVMILSGALVGLQHPLNAELADHIGGLDAAFLNFLTGTVMLAVFALIAGEMAGVAKAREVRWYYLLGGFVGVITVLTALTAVETIGAAGLTAALVTGQLLSSIALDRFGAFGLEKRLVTPVRVAGVVLLIAGTFLTVS